MDNLLLRGLVALLTLPNTHRVLPHFHLLHLDVEFSLRGMFLKGLRHFQKRITASEFPDGLIYFPLGHGFQSL